MTSASPELSGSPVSTNNLRLDDLMRLVLERNEALQVRFLDFQISQKKRRASRGIFEPELVGSYEHQDSKRENTAEQVRSLRTDVFEERNNLYSGGLESLVPTGAKVRLGYTLRDLRNNLDRRSLFGNGTNFLEEYSSFLGVNLTQPLLKNAWASATMAEIRLAALASDVAFQDYRRQLMVTLSAAEAGYWNLYIAQKQVQFLQESAGVADTILRDNRGRLQAGKGSELEVLEAESGLALRQTKLNEAFQKYYEAVNRLRALYADGAQTNQVLVTADDPQPRGTNAPTSDSFAAAFTLNPDYLGQLKKVRAEEVRLAYAKNQRWPQLDLKASYGLNGLGDTPGGSWDDVSHAGFPSWTVGAELRVPIGGGIRVRNELEAARLRKQQALISLKEIETQIATALDTTLQKVRSARDTVERYRAVVNFTAHLLETQLARLEVGKVESRKVLETDADLFEAKNSLADAQVQYQRALIELELLEGSTLQRRHLDLTQRELERRTADLVKKGRFSPADYAAFMDELRAEQKRQDAPPLTSEDYERAFRALREFRPPPPGSMPPAVETKASDRPKAAPVPPLSEQDYQKALERLRQLTNPHEPPLPR